MSLGLFFFSSQPLPCEDGGELQQIPFLAGGAIILQRAAPMSGAAQVTLTITPVVVRGACVLCPFFLSEKPAKKTPKE